MVTLSRCEQIEEESLKGGSETLQAILFQILKW